MLLATDTLREVSIWELALMMKRIGGFTSEIEIVSASELYSEGYDDIPRRVPDTTKIKTVLGWSPKVKLEEGLQRTIKGYVERESGGG